MSDWKASRSLLTRGDACCGKFKSHLTWHEGAVAALARSAARALTDEKRAALLDEIRLAKADRAAARQELENHIRDNH